jgi:hypothetical protein
MVTPSKFIMTTHDETKTREMRASVAVGSCTSCTRHASYIPSSAYIHLTYPEHEQDRPHTNELHAHLLTSHCEEDRHDAEPQPKPLRRRASTATLHIDQY